MQKEQTKLIKNNNNLRVFPGSKRGGGGKILINVRILGIFIIIIVFCIFRRLSNKPLCFPQYFVCGVDLCTPRGVWGDGPPEEKFVRFKNKFINLVHFESSK